MCFNVRVYDSSIASLDLLRICIKRANALIELFGGRNQTIDVPISKTDVPEVRANASFLLRLGAVRNKPKHQRVSHAIRYELWIDRSVDDTGWLLR